MIINVCINIKKTGVLTWYFFTLLSRVIFNDESKKILPQLEGQSMIITPRFFEGLWSPYMWETYTKIYYSSICSMSPKKTISWYLHEYPIQSQLSMDKLRVSR